MRSAGKIPAASAPMAQDTIFRIFSMTKPIVSVGIMMLLEEGHFLLNDPVAKFIPEFADQKVGVENNGKLELVPLTRPMTIQDLLRHTSGITYDHTGNGLVQQLYQQSRLRSRKINNAEHAAMVASLPLICQPGAEWNYSRSTDILGRIIEVVSGKTLERVPDRAHPGAAADGRDRVSYRRRKCRPARRAVPDRSLDRREGAALQHAGKAGDGIRRRRSCLHHHGLRPLLPDAAQWRQLDGTRIIGRKTLELMASDHLGPTVKIMGPLMPAGHGFGLGFAVRTQAGHRAVLGLGRPVLLERHGRNLLLDRSEGRPVRRVHVQGPGQREYIRTLVRSGVRGGGVSFRIRQLAGLNPESRYRGARPVRATRARNDSVGQLN